ncbi:MAG: hypothetical protein JO255_10635 [Alphaproteobacteria bacterium]|nr:hypothetical protein [Alphaproteobacteria bacterium]
MRNSYGSIAAVVALAVAGSLCGAEPGLAAPAAADFCTPAAPSASIAANPSNYRTILPTLKPGDTLTLEPGVYVRLDLDHLNGRKGSCITIAGPASGAPAVIRATPGHDTVEITQSSYLAVRNLTIDSLGLPGSHGISAKGNVGNVTHHVLIEGNRVLGAGGSQQTDGISTKIPTWNWIIRRNTIIGAGTALYLGNSDGDDPFIAGIIEDNLVMNPIGYCMEVKYQKARPVLDGMPTDPQTTIIRNNVFIKNDRPSPDGDRPNLLVGGFPDSGPGAQDLYQIYGNLIFHNPREALFQASGRVSFHDNILVDGERAAAVFRNHDLPLRLAHVYSNTVYSARKGIYFADKASEGDAVAGNLVFAETPISGAIVHQRGNTVGTLADAGRYLRAPSASLGSMDFFPLPGKARGPRLDLTPFAGDVDYDIDFNQLPKGSRALRGAYSGDGTNPGWRLQAAIKTLR